MYEFWYDYVKPKCKNDANTKLCYIDTDSFIVIVETDNIYNVTVKDIETLQILKQTDLKEKIKK